MGTAGLFTGFLVLAGDQSMIGGKSGQRMELASAVSRLEKLISPCSLQSQNSTDPASK